jgi:hypothetical protein
MMKKLDTNEARPHLRLGWTLIAIAFAAGVLLEALLGTKAIAVGEDALRKELWSLAHFHAAFLGLLNLVYPRVSEVRSRALLTGSLLLPLGFFLGGVAHPEGDPGVGIWLAPFGAMLLVYVAASRAVEAWRR